MEEKYEEEEQDEEQQEDASENEDLEQPDQQESSAPIDPKIQEEINQREKALRDECIKQKQSVNLSNSDIDDIDCVALSLFFLEKRFQLKFLHLGSNGITDEGLITLLQSVQWHASTLTELYLGKNPVTELGLNALIEVIPVFTSLEILSLYETNFTDQNMINFSLQASALKNLRQLFLNSNEIEDEGLMCFTTLLTEQEMRLHVLHLGNNELTFVSLKHFFQQLYRYDSLRILYLNNIAMDKDCMKYLNYMLLKNKHLEELNLSCCNIQLEQLQMIEESLRVNRSLKTLHLFGNPLNDDCMRLLLDILDNNNNFITNITVSDEMVDDLDLIDHLKEYLQQNVKFKDPQNSIVNIIKKQADPQFKQRFEKEIEKQYLEETKSEQKQQSSDRPDTNATQNQEQKEEQDEAEEKKFDEIMKYMQEDSESSGSDENAVEKKAANHSKGQKLPPTDKARNNRGAADKESAEIAEASDEEEEEQGVSEGDSEENNQDRDEKQLDDLQELYEGIEESRAFFEEQQAQADNEMEQDVGESQEQDAKKQTPSKSNSKQQSSGRASQAKKGQEDAKKQTARPQSAKVPTGNQTQHKKDSKKEGKAFKEHAWQGFEKDGNLGGVYHSKYK